MLIMFFLMIINFSTDPSYSFYKIDAILNSSASPIIQYNNTFRQQRRNSVVNKGEVPTGCLPSLPYDYSHAFTFDKIKVNYYSGLSFIGFFENDEEEYSLDIPLNFKFDLTDEFGFVEHLRFHFGHEKAKTDEQKIVGFLPGFEIPVDEYYLYFTKDRLNIEVGRRKVFWGPGNYNSVFISDNLFLDMIRIDYRSDNITLENIITFLDPSTNTYMAAQRFEISLFNKKVMLGINEAIVWSKDISWDNMNPVSPYYIIQRYLGTGNNNVLGGADIQFIIGNNARFYFQGMVDDVSFSPPEPPERLGFLWGSEIYNIFGRDNLDFYLEFSGVAPYTYSHFDYRDSIEINGYYRNDTAVGHILGNNFWDGLFEITWRNDNFKIYLLSGITFQGPYNLADPWTWNKPPNPKWPSGIIEKKSYVDLKLFYTFSRVELMFNGVYEHFINKDWEEGKVKDNTIFGIYGLFNL